MAKGTEIKLETRGGGCYGGSWASLDPMRLFVVARDNTGKKINEIEVEIINGVLKPKASTKEAKDG